MDRETYEQLDRIEENQRYIIKMLDWIKHGDEEADLDYEKENETEF